MLAAMNLAPTGNANFTSLEVADVAIRPVWRTRRCQLLTRRWGTYSFGLQQRVMAWAAHFYDDTPATTDAALVKAKMERRWRLVSDDTVEG